MDSRRRAGVPDRAVPAGASPRQPSARDQALARVNRWKRRIAVTAVVGFGALLGLVGATGARGSATTSTPPSVSDRSGGGREAAPRQAADDGFFGSGGEDRGFSFGDGGSQGLPFGRSGAS